jgi:hypothetical protein
VTITPDSVRVEVIDDNSRLPRIVYQDVDALCGRGLAISDTLAACWGVGGRTPGKVVWFEVRIS